MIATSVLSNMMTDYRVKEGVNSCGKDVFIVSDKEMFKRFIMLGSENGTYYIGKEELTTQHVICLENMIRMNWKDIIGIMSEFCNRVYKQDSLIYALARCCAEFGNRSLREEAYKLLPTICKTPTHLFMFVDMYERVSKSLHGSTGWNKMHKRSVSLWYLNTPISTLAYLVTKYRKRNDWTHADVLRLCHAKPTHALYNALFAYITHGYELFHEKIKLAEINDIFGYIKDYERLKITTDPGVAITMIEYNGFVREHVPEHLLNDIYVWNALCQNMPMVALLRNLNKMTSIGLFDVYPSTLNKINNQLSSIEHILQSGIHPLQILVALRTYSCGHGMLGNLSWTPKASILRALETAFQLSFKNVEPSNKRILLALDVSGSMVCNKVAGITCMSASEISAAMATIYKTCEKQCHVMGFSDEFKELNIVQNDVRQNMCNVRGMTFGSTDISLPFLWAMQNEKLYDAFIVITDNETNCNHIPPSEALNLYREHSGIPDAKLIVIATSANSFSTADPNDLNMIDIAGFDAETPRILNDFISNKLFAS